MRWQCRVHDDVMTPASGLGAVLLVGALVLVALVDEPVRGLRLLAREAPEPDGRLQGGSHPPQPAAHRREKAVLLSIFLRTKRRFSTPRHNGEELGIVWRRELAGTIVSLAENTAISLFFFPFPIKGRGVHLKVKLSSFVYFFKRNAILF